jgi:hypothetical protein
MKILIRDIDDETHKQARFAALKLRLSLNKFVIEAIKEKIDRQPIDKKEMTNMEIKNRLEYLRKEIRAERISYGEIAELQSLVKFIDKDDLELLECAGVPEKGND